MPHVLSDLQPQKVFDYFYQITQVPRPSKKEEKIRAYIVQLAKSMGYPFKEDASGNIIVRKPASKGREKSSAVVLQGHLDMVCEKANDLNFDFDNESLKVRVDGEWVKATGTTLGADNGIAVAAMLAILEDKKLLHGPLELLFTIDEETGLTGANRLEPKMLKGKYLLNLDSEDEGVLFVGCAGGKDATLALPVKWKDADRADAAVEIKVEGCTGGHSGLDIHLGRANAIKILTRVLWNLYQEFGLRISDIHGGSKRNAIPREASAVITVNAEKLPLFLKSFQKLQKTIKPVYQNTDPNLSISLMEKPERVKYTIKKTQTATLLNLLNAMPHGVLAMSFDIPGLVETSVNLATIECSKHSIVLGSNQRSSIESEKRELMDRILSVAELAGATVEESDGYPGWKPNMESRILALARETFEEIFGKEPHVTAVHAGLECGIIGSKFPEMEMISFGPTIKNAHSPDECLHIPTVKPFYNAIIRMLEKLA